MISKAILGLTKVPFGEYVFKSKSKFWRAKSLAEDFYDYTNELGKLEFIHYIEDMGRIYVA